MSDDQAEVTIDCESRIHLCKAACCRLRFELSPEEVRGGVVRWDPAQPYANACGDDGACVHLDRDLARCTIYTQRPAPCRRFDCRLDRRIWLDFERGVINPRIDEPNWPDCLRSAEPVGLTLMEGRPAGGLLLTDATGASYLLPAEVLTAARVPEALKGEIERLLRQDRPT